MSLPITARCARSIRLTQGSHSSATSLALGLMSQRVSSLTVLWYGQFPGSASEFQEIPRCRSRDAAGGVFAGLPVIYEYRKGAAEHTAGA